MRSVQTFFSLLLLVGAGAVVAYGQQGASGTGGESSQEAAATFPEDIDPQSRNRLPVIQREELDELGQQLYNASQSDSRALVWLQGPQGIRLYSPRVSEYMRMGNQFLRYDAGLDPRLVELAILVAAREMDSQFEWTVHEPAARKAGLEQEIIDVVRDRRPITQLGEKESLIIQLGREALGKHKVSSNTFARALKLFGKRELVHWVSLIGHYAATAVLLTTFDQQIAPGQKPLLPIP